jgi:Macrocin-O-methyltransferase (TylF)
MSEIKETSPTMHDPVTQSLNDYSYREALQNYFETSPGSSTEKLENFSKYVPRQNLARFLARYEIFKLIENIQGSIVECGVLFGGGLMSFANLSVILEPYNFQRRIIGFDTFTGFPGISDQDQAGLSERKSAHLKEGGFSAVTAYDDLLKAIEIFNKNRFLNHFPKVNVVKGDFAVTSRKFLEDYPHLIISCLYLDFDIYAPTKIALECFVPRVPKGGVIVFDELNEEAFPGETIAVMEYFNINNLKVRRFPFEPRISYVVMGE